jgi:hypothetical protein
MPRAKPISVVPIRRMARGIVMLRKSSLVSTCSVFCNMIMTPSMVNMVMLIILKRFMPVPIRLYIFEYTRSISQMFGPYQVWQCC